MKINFYLQGDKLVNEIERITNDDSFEWGCMTIDWKEPTFPVTGDFFDWFTFLDALEYSEEQLYQLEKLSSTSTIYMREWRSDKDVYMNCFLDLAK